MGYRSDVAYYISFKNKEQRETFLNTLQQMDDKYIQDVLKDGILMRVDNCALAAHHTDVKWYESYEDVKAEERIMEYALEWFPEDAAFKFLRIGEEDDDIETTIRGENVDTVYDKCYVVRSVYTDWRVEKQDATD